MTVTLYLVAETELARKFQKEQERGQIPRPQQFWLPRSQCKSCLKMAQQVFPESLTKQIDHVRAELGRILDEVEKLKPPTV